MAATATATTYLITGANRGIGRALADLILARPHTTLVALVRDPEHETAKSLGVTPARGLNTRLVVLPYDAKDIDSAATAVAAAQRDHGITHLDVLVANAGGLSCRGPTVDTPAEAIHDHITVNAIGPLLLFRACLPLLQSPARSQANGDGDGTVTAEKGPAKVVAISSAIGSTGLVPKFAQSQTLPYGLSKAALNHTFRKLSVEYPDLIIQLLTPGPVRTDLTRDFEHVFQAALKANPQLANRFEPIDKVSQGLLDLIDTATKDTSGSFRDWKGEVVEW